MTPMTHLLSNVRRARCLATTVLAAGLVVLTGCSSSGSTSNGSGSMSSTPVAPSASSGSSLVIEHDVAYELGYRIDWQAPGGGHELRHVSAQGDSVFALDDRNLLSRYDADTGDRIWSTPVSKPQVEVLGITFIPGIERVYVTTGGAILVLDAGTGGQIGRQDLEKLASTAPIQMGKYLIYGTRNGQVAWHALDVGYNWRSYEVAPGMNVGPQMYERNIIAVGSDGTVAVLDGRTVTRLWERTFGVITADPAVGLGTVFVCGRDQHVRGLDVGTGQQVWSYITEDELHTSPVLIGQRLYQQIPSEGLVCFNALPMGKPGGEVIWKSAGTNGTVVTQGQHSLLVWDDRARTMTMVDIRSGSAADKLSLPRVAHLQTDSADRGVIFASSSNGRLMKLVPRNS